MGLGRGRLIALGATGAGLMLALLVGLNTVLAPTYVPLYSQLSPSSASEILSSLEQAGMTAQLSADGSSISVAQDDLARARMALADRGLPNEGVPGWELFDDSTGLGMNTFLQRVNRLRALEGELARSIQTIEGIDAARVHLVLPEREAFSRNRPEPSASVIVRGSASHDISMRQAMSIRALVASAVADLSGNRVTVLSASGETILAEDGVGAAEVTLQSTRASIEERLARNINQILTARVGAGNARVQVSVDLNTERQRTVSRSFDPDQQVARSVETREEEIEDRDAAAGSVDVGQNLPEALAEPAGAGASNSRNRTDEIVNYEIGSTERESTREPGEIERVSVAVLVNGIYNVAQGGDVAYEERAPEELERLAALVRSAIGFDETRGDTVSIDSLRFIDYSMDVGDPVGRSVSQILTDNLMTILRSLFALAVIALIMAFGSKPLRALASSAGGGHLALAGAPVEALEGGAQRSQLAAPERTGAGGPAALPSPAPRQTVLDPETPGGETVRLASVAGDVAAGRIEEMGELAERNPDEALRVLRSWLAED